MESVWVWFFWQRDTSNFIVGTRSNPASCGSCHPVPFRPNTTGAAKNRCWSACLVPPRGKAMCSWVKRERETGYPIQAHLAASCNHLGIWWWQMMVTLASGCCHPNIYICRMPKSHLWLLVETVDGHALHVLLDRCIRLSAKEMSWSTIRKMKLVIF